MEITVLKMTFIVLVFLFLVLFTNAYHVPECQMKQYRHPYERQDLERKSSYPFISGDGFRAIANWIIDDYGCSFDASKVEANDTIFIKTDFISDFATNLAPKINVPFIIITHNSDYSVPMNEADERMLDNILLIRWFAINPKSYHAKMIPIPLGLDSLGWKNGDPNLFPFRTPEELQTGITKDVNHTRLLLVSFRISEENNIKLRNRVFEELVSKSRFEYLQFDSTRRFLEEVRNSEFVACPEGNGMDTHRFWQTLLMGSIPVVEYNPTLFPLWEHLPVLVVDNWSQVIRELLESKRDQLRFNRQIHLERIFLQYWMNEISKVTGRSLMIPLH